MQRLSLVRRESEEQVRVASRMEEQAMAHTILSPERAPPGKGPSRTFWITLSVALLCGIICVTVAGAVCWIPASAKVVRVNVQSCPGSQTNQSAVISQPKNTIIYYVTSSRNQTAVILFDCRKGYVCYKPPGQKKCYLKRMDAQDHDVARLSFNLSEHWVDPPLLSSDTTQYHRQFLRIVSGGPVRPAEAGEAAGALCKQAPIYWVKKAHPPQQRLIYLCIDICFPNNICVSICFYYLPD